jgi:hypothetical protein
MMEERPVDCQEEKTDLQLTGTMFMAVIAWNGLRSPATVECLKL